MHNEYTDTPNTMGITLGVQYARAFATDFAAEIAETDASPDHSVIIEASRFDDFIVRHGLGGITYVPDRRAPEYQLFRLRRNSVRVTMNNAAVIGQHGDPPFRLDVESRGIRQPYLKLRNLTGVAEVSYKDAETYIGSLIENKLAQLGIVSKDNGTSRLGRIAEALLHDKHDYLDDRMKLAVASLQQNFTLCSNIMTNTLRQFMEQNKSVIEQASAMIAARRAAQAIAAPQAKQLQAPDDADSAA